MVPEKIVVDPRDSGIEGSYRLYLRKQALPRAYGAASRYMFEVLTITRAQLTWPKGWAFGCPSTEKFETCPRWGPGVDMHGQCNTINLTL
jgi:hypothetical protein